jgi:uncharacterized protein DUF2382
VPLLQVEKKPVVNEEVRVGKRHMQHSKRVSDTVRHEELRGEHEDDVEEERLRHRREEAPKGVSAMCIYSACENACPLFLFGRD